MAQKQSTTRKVTYIFKNNLISANFHYLSMTSKSMLIKNNHNKSAQPSPYPPLLSLFFGRGGLTYKTLPKTEQQRKSTTL